jgi:ankyrin repeat protein
MALGVGGAFYGCSGGADIEVGNPMSGSVNFSPAEQMLQAAAWGDIDAMTSLVGWDPRLVHAVGVNGVTPLHVAAESGKNASVTFLLEHGADPTVQDDNGSTPVNTANVEGQRATAKIIQDWIASRRAN